MFTDYNKIMLKTLDYTSMFKNKKHNSKWPMSPRKKNILIGIKMLT